MNIGLISINMYTHSLNFASVLHTYIFQEFLKDNGIDSTIIDYQPHYYNDYDLKHPLFYHIDHPNNDSEKQNELLKKWKALFYVREIRYEKFMKFINSNYKKTIEVYNAKILDEVELDFDCYICVTDVIWKNNKTGFDKGFFLSCKAMNGKKKIAYAASRGPSDGSYAYTPERQDEFLKNIKDFSFISVREKSFQDYIQKITGTKIPHVVDPVFLKDKSFYEELAIKPNRKNKFILVYLVMVNNKPIVKEAMEFAKIYGYEVIEISEVPENENYPKGTHHEIVYDIGIEEWLGYMIEAEYIFTNSFHACCFSIILHKQVYPGSRGGDKINSVLEMFGLSWRRTLPENKGISVNMKDIDYTKIQPFIEEYVKYSTSYILNAIKVVDEEIENERTISGNMK